MIRQHHPTGSDADAARAGRDMADNDRGRSRGDAGHVVMLGDPEAPVAKAFGMAREFQRIAQRVGGARAFDDR